MLKNYPELEALRYIIAALMEEVLYPFREW